VKAAQETAPLIDELTDFGERRVAEMGRSGMVPGSSVTGFVPFDIIGT